jgi:hypothetical protein
VPGDSGVQPGLAPDDGTGQGGAGDSPANVGDVPTVLSPGETLRVREPASTSGLLGSVVGGAFGLVFGP